MGFDLIESAFGVNMKISRLRSPLLIHAVIVAEGCGPIQEMAAGPRPFDGAYLDIIDAFQYWSDGEGPRELTRLHAHRYMTAFLNRIRS